MVDLNNLTGIVSTPSEITGMIEAVTGSRLEHTGTFSISSDTKEVEVHDIPFIPKVLIVYPNSSNLALSDISSTSRFYLFFIVAGPGFRYNFYGYKTSTTLASASLRRTTSGVTIDFFDNGFSIKVSGTNYYPLSRNYSYVAFA